MPIISAHFNVGVEMSRLTQQTVKGDIPFVESFIKRTHVLGNLPISEVNDLLASVPLLERIVCFIKENQSDCIVATGNFNGWIENLVKKIGCRYFSSDGVVENNRVTNLTRILKKEDVVNQFKSQGEEVVFIGDGNNDAEAMRDADISIACGIVHKPAVSVLEVADYAVYSEESLYRLLNQIHTKQKGKSVILSCAGVGARLGLGQTKALIKMEEKPLIHYQLDHLESVEDIRVVVGFQAQEVVKTVLEKRRDIVFVYNHDYFHTKTGASYYLGARHGNEYAVAWDGDLLVHPKDVGRCLNYDGEFIGCSDIVSDDPVFVKLDGDKVIGFSRKNGDFEWIGPACLSREKIKFSSGNVFNQFESYLPLPMIKINARDIDTYDDYLRAKKFINSWGDCE